MNAIDMAQFIAPKSDQLNADDLIGGPRTIRITRVSANESAPEQPINIFYEGDDGKPFRPCKSMRRVMVAVWGADASQYVGRGMTLYRDPKVQFGGMQVGGIRISHMTHIDEPKTMALTATRAKRAPYTVKPLAMEQKVDKAAEGVAALIARIAAEGLTVADDPQVVKQRAWLAKNRPELAAQVDAALAAEDDDPFGTATGDGSAEADGQPEDEEVAASSSQQEGPADSQRGEVPSLDEAKAAVDRAEFVPDVNKTVTSYEGQLSEEDQDALRAHAMERIATLKAKAK